ncbi:MAG: hypothetical protein QOH03_5266, partial [Kribbellaceae bacterium]|nr:hypothetical protein [Kribbellaceae bacterium]
MITERIDPDDPTAFDEWHGVMWAALSAGREFAVGWAREEMRIAVTRKTPYFERELWAARDEAGQVVGFLYLELPQKDNTSLVFVDVGVLPDRRRQGFGTALVKVAEERITHHGRTIVHSMVHSPLGTETAGQVFARHHGMTVGNADRHRILRLPIERALLEELAVEVADHHRDYRLVSWEDRCPDDLVDAYAALESTFLSEAPMGDLEMENEVFDAARIRANEALMAAAGRRKYTTVAIA